MSDDTKNTKDSDSQGRGRPSLYKPEYCEQLIEHMRGGNSFWTFAAKTGTHFDTLSEWTRKHPDFSEAKKIGMALLLEFDENLGKAGTAGQLERRSRTIRRTIKHKDGRVENIEEDVYDATTFSASYHRFMMRNRYRTMYADKLIVDTTPANKTNATDVVKSALENNPEALGVLRDFAKKLSEPQK